MPAGIFGVAAEPDVVNFSNTRDDSVLVFSDRLLASYPTFAKTALATVSAHEAGHAFGLRHTEAGNQTAQSDLIAAPGIAASATLAFVHAWNEFLFAYVLINDTEKRVLAVGLSSYVEQFTTDYSGLFAMATRTTLPVVVVLMVFQRYLVGGLAAAVFEVASGFFQLLFIDRDLHFFVGRLDARGTIDEPSADARESHEHQQPQQLHCSPPRETRDVDRSPREV